MHLGVTRHPASQGIRLTNRTEDGEGTRGRGQKEGCAVGRCRPSGLMLGKSQNEEDRTDRARRRWKTRDALSTNANARTKGTRYCLTGQRRVRSLTRTGAERRRQTRVTDSRQLRRPCKSLDRVKRLAPGGAYLFGAGDSSVRSPAKTSRQYRHPCTFFTHRDIDDLVKSSKDAKSTR